MRAATDEPDAAAVAAELRRLAVLLQAGIPPARAWGHLRRAAADPADAADGADAAGASAPDPDRIGDALAARGGAWSEVAVAWRVAATVGAPLAPSLRSIAEALRDAHESLDDVRVALAEPAATARLVAWLPLVAVALGGLLGFDVVGTATHPVGLACLAGGVVLMIVARRWSAALVARARPAPGVPGLQAEVVAIALSGGVSIDRALSVVADAGAGAPQPETLRILELSRSAGAPAVELLRAEAADARHRARTEGRLRAAALGSRLLLPMGVCTLPAFLLLGVGPMLLSVLATTPLEL